MLISKKSKILFVIPWDASFINYDIKILSCKYTVIVNKYQWLNKRMTLFYMIRQFFFLLYHIKNTKAIIVSFGGYWAFIPSLMFKLMGKPVYIILNGMDCAALTTINYGILRKPFLKFICKLSYSWAYNLLPVSSSLIYTKNDYFCYDKPEDYIQGYGHYFPSMKNKGKVIHNGIDWTFWKKDENIKKFPKSFIAVLSSGQFFLKGGDLIIEVAKKIPECKFYIAGIEKPRNIDYDITANVLFLGKITSIELRKYYSKIQFHFQLSIFEGFGCALCEAMLCECVPIGSSVNIIPEIIGDCGFILGKRDSKLLKNMVIRAISSTSLSEIGRMARNRIIEKYSFETRKENLLGIIDSGFNT